MKQKIDRAIKKAIRNILLEKSKEDNKKEDNKKEDNKKEDNKKEDNKTPEPTSGAAEILTRGAFGSGGRSRSFVASAKARAEADPEGLMKDLGITSAASGSDLEKVLRILNIAIHSNSVMSKAYAGVSIREDKPSGDGKPKRAVAVSLKDLDRKNGVRFLAYTLTAAQNVGFLNLDKSIQFAVGTSYPIIIYTP